MKDTALVEKCKQGDRKAMETLYHQYHPKMRGLCVRYAKTEFEIEDILQEAFIKIFINIKNFNNLGSFEGWMKRIVVNTAINSYWKNLSFNTHLNFENVEESNMDPVEIADRLSVDELHQVIAKLPEGYRFVFNMFAIDGYSHKEIADMLCITESSSRSQYTRAKKHIINLLQKQNVTHEG
jgi:RNA polymerase sigma factor (sigma-70 family)